MAEKIKNVKFKVAGVTFTNDDGTPRQSVLAELQERKDEPIDLVREPTNPFDVNAIKVVTVCGQAGYIPKDFAATLAKMIDEEGRKFTAVVSDTGFYKNNHFLHITVNEV